MTNSIDWEAQWATHSPGFRDGYLHLEVNEKPLKLKPGPGFGDLSHPTTNLVLRLMKHHVVGKHVLDIGCGSGILSFAAAAMGAASVVGIDIDEEAIQHSKSNCKVNKMEGNITFMQPNDYIAHYTQEPLVVLMNMIHSEQCIAWESVKAIHPQVKIAIISGILAEGRKDYLKQSQTWGWILADEAERNGWLGFVFKPIQ